MVALSTINENLENSSSYWIFSDKNFPNPFANLEISLELKWNSEKKFCFFWRDICLKKLPNSWICSKEKLDFTKCQEFQVMDFRVVWNLFFSSKKAGASFNFWMSSDFLIWSRCLSVRRWEYKYLLWQLFALIGTKFARIFVSSSIIVEHC